MRKLLLIGFGLLTSPAAWAQGEPLDVLKEIKCPAASGIIPAEQARIALIRNAFPGVPEELIEALATSDFGTVARDRYARGKADASVTLFTKLIDTFADADADAVPSEGSPVVVSIKPTAEEEADAVWADLFLNGNHDWAIFKCLRKSAPAEGGQNSRRDDNDAAKFPPIVIAESQADLQKAFKDRKYAKLGLESQDGDTTLTANLVIGLQPLPLWNRGTFYQVSWSPFLEYNRKTAGDPAKEINSVMLGAGLDYAVGPRSFPILMDTDAAWQTDDDGEASLWRIQHQALIPLFDLCRMPNEGGLFWSCSLAVGADYVKVDDPGTNPQWAALKDFARAGVDFEWYAGHDFGKARVSLLAAYNSRFDLSDDDTTAELKTLKLTLEPDKEGQFSFSATYKRGKELKTLADVDTFSLELGYRQ